MSGSSIRDTPYFYFPKQKIQCTVSTLDYLLLIVDHIEHRSQAAGIKAAARAQQAHEASVKRESDQRLRAAMAKAKREMAKVKAAAELPWNGPATLPPPSKEVCGPDI